MAPLFRRQIICTHCDYYIGRIFQRAIIVSVLARRRMLAAIDFHDREADTFVIRCLVDGTGQSPASRELHISSHDTVNVSFVADTAV